MSPPKFNSSLTIKTMLLTLVTSVALALPATSVPAEHGKLPWYEGTLAEALKEAKAENKIIFIDFWTDW